MTSQPRWLTLLATALLSWGIGLPNKATDQIQLSSCRAFESWP